MSEVGEILGGVSRSRVLQMINEGEIRAIKSPRSREMLIPIGVLSAYQARLRGEVPSVVLPEPTCTHEEAISRFESDTGMTPEQWMEAWKDESIEDSAANMSVTVQALSILYSDSQ